MLTSPFKEYVVTLQYLLVALGLLSQQDLGDHVYLECPFHPENQSTTLSSV